jgi:hypothetical protein
LVPMPDALASPEPPPRTVRLVLESVNVVPAETVAFALEMTVFLPFEALAEPELPPLIRTGPETANVIAWPAVKDALAFDVTVWVPRKAPLQQALAEVSLPPETVRLAAVKLRFVPAETSALALRVTAIVPFPLSLQHALADVELPPRIVTSPAVSDSVVPAEIVALDSEVTAILTSPP